MIRGYFWGVPGRRRPFVAAYVDFPVLAVQDHVQLLVDTGADATLLAPQDVRRLRIPLSELRPGPGSVGVGGRSRTLVTPANITLGRTTIQIMLRILAPDTRSSRQSLDRIPSLLGRDVLSQFALFMHEQTDRVILLEAGEVDAIYLP